jgi:hypothetical protein
MKTALEIIGIVVVTGSAFIAWAMVSTAAAYDEAMRDAHGYEDESDGGTLYDIHPDHAAMTQAEMESRGLA